MRVGAPRTLPSPTLRNGLAAVLWSVAATAVVWADEAPGPPAGDVRLASGRIVDYTIHFDRNALRDSLRLGDGLIALTSSGCLLRFTLPEVRLVRERVGTEQVVCLGRGEGDASLAGLGDGRVCRIDPVTLDLSTVVRFHAPPRWIAWGEAVGSRSAGLVAVTRPRPGSAKPIEHFGQRQDVSSSVVHDLATGKTFALEEEPTAFLLDRTGRVWLGGDRGERGGWVTRVDLVKGTVAPLDPPPSREPGFGAAWEAVCGFVALRDGQVWAYGGSSHRGVKCGQITRVDGDEPRALSSEKPGPSLPPMPITQVVEEDGGLLVVLHHEVFRVDRALKSWTKTAMLDLPDRWGRPGAVGSGPSVRVVHPPRRPGEAYVLATAGDGYVLLEGARATSRRLPGQLGAARVERVENSSEGTLFFEGDDRLPVWRLGAGGWETASFAPPMEPDPTSGSALGGFEGQPQRWYETRVLVGPAGTISTVSGSSPGPGRRTTARWVDGKPERLGGETSSLVPSSSFITGDGTLWNASNGMLRRFREDQWKYVSSLPRQESPSDPEVIPLPANGSPWLLLDRRGDALWRLTIGPKGNPPRLHRVTTRDGVDAGARPLRVLDAIFWSDDTLVLATDAGLRLKGRARNGQWLLPVELPESERPATVLARDGRGRLWLGSDHGLWLAEPGAEAPELFDRVPLIGRQKVHDLAPDPHREAGVIVALGARGVAFIRARDQP